MYSWADKLQNVPPEHPEMEKFLPEIKEKLAGLDREELLRRVVSLEFDRFLDDYRHGEDLIEPVPGQDFISSRSGNKQSRSQYQGNFTRLFINLGKSDGFYPEQLIELINTRTRGRKIPIGKIDLMKNFSFFEVSADQSETILKNLNGASFMDRQVVVEPAQEKESGQREHHYGRKGSGRPAQRPGTYDNRKKRDKRRDKDTSGRAKKNKSW
jgi:ATP-dependent RNA helicase DeaD